MTQTTDAHIILLEAKTHNSLYVLTLSAPLVMQSTDKTENGEFMTSSQ